MINLAYLTFNLVLGLRMGGASFIAVSVYYALHIYIRYTILSVAMPEDKGRAYAVCRKGGMLLFLAGILVSPMLIFGAASFSVTSYSLPVLIFLSSYAVYTLISASVGIAVCQKDCLPVRRAAYSVRLASGAVSLYNPLVLFFSRAVRGGAAAKALGILSGIAVSVFILYLSCFMIFSSAENERCV